MKTALVYLRIYLQFSQDLYLFYFQTLFTRLKIRWKLDVDYYQIQYIPLDYYFMAVLCFQADRSNYFLGGDSSIPSHLADRIRRKF